ncbi:hypothetical protein UFOVP648_26 [uncultured Caudovirales phage]|jgi:hypothetical protein|uniref:Uncharacterized protein n=1 Tax=uncultured Caudovirales phage TaxID=2100421 RepID=A0A6J5NH33_9CAUD|nr:hypothetical protein UFOVP648_26 [uncultured Caudovirales phage]
MNISTKLITPQYIKDTTVVQQLVADINLDSFIYQTQDFFLRPTLGTDLYNNLINEVVLNSGSTTGLTSSTYQTLLDYSQPYLAYMVVYEAFPYLSIKIANNGLIRRTGQGDFEPISLDELKYFRQDVFNKANSMKTLLEQFLNDNKSTYYTTEIKDDCDNNIRKTLGGIYF